MPWGHCIADRELLGISLWAATPLLDVERVQEGSFPYRIAPSLPWLVESNAAASHPKVLAKSHSTIALPLEGMHLDCVCYTSYDKFLGRIGKTDVVFWEAFDTNVWW
jgi:hypothetical protein